MRYSTGMQHERIGEFLLRIGAITEEQLQEVLEKQKAEPHERFGEIAISLGYINDEAIDRFLENRKKES